MLSVIMLSVIMLSVIMLNVTYKPFVLSVCAECRYAKCCGVLELTLKCTPPPCRVTRAIIYKCL